MPFLPLPFDNNGMPKSGSEPLLAGRRRVPPHAYFVVSAIFHYLGPAFAVLLFVRVEPLGVAWLRIASAALVFALWRRPWRGWRGVGPGAPLLLRAPGAPLPGGK